MQNKKILTTMKQSKGLFTRKSDFALGLQVHKANNIFLCPKMDWFTAKSRSEIGHVNKP